MAHDRDDIATVRRSCPRSIRRPSSSCSSRWSSSGCSAPFTWRPGRSDRSPTELTHVAFLRTWDRWARVREMERPSLFPIRVALTPLRMPWRRADGSAQAAPARRAHTGAVRGRRHRRRDPARALDACRGDVSAAFALTGLDLTRRGGAGARHARGLDPRRGRGRRAGWPRTTASRRRRNRHDDARCSTSRAGRRRPRQRCVRPPPRSTASAGRRRDVRPPWRAVVAGGR